MARPFEDLLKRQARKVTGVRFSVTLTCGRFRDGRRQAILAGTEKPTIWGPAGQSWVELINQDWQLKHRRPFVTEVRDTVNTALLRLSPPAAAEGSARPEVF